MKNYVQAGLTIEVTAPAAVSSGDGVLVGKLFGVAVSDAESGAAVQIQTQGVFELPKAAGALAQGAEVYWDNTAKNLTATSTSNTKVGAVVVAALSGDAAVIAKITGQIS